MPRFYVRRDGTRRPQDGHRAQKVYVPDWVDPYWFINGSEPEKRVLAELVRRGIYFQHVPQSNTVGGLVPADWEADFLIPQYRIWIEVNGLYFHTLPGAVENDALRYAKIEASGWRLIVWWDYDILTRLPELMDAVPEFRMVENAHNQKPNADRTPGLPFYTGGLEVDHLAGLRKALSNRARTPQFEYRFRLPGTRRPK